MKQLAFLTLILLLTACLPSTETVPQVSAPRPTSTYDFSGVHLRLHNGSGEAFTAVAITSGSQTKQIGTLAPNEASDYYTFTAVQQPPTIHVSTDQQTYTWTSESTAAAGFIAGGQFTLALTIENEQLLVQPVLENAILHQAQYYADEMGVTLEEALFRLDMQSDEAISILNNQLQRNEANTFAGLWWQHEPDYRVVVAFTQDGEETIGKYIDTDSLLASLIDTRSAQYSYAQLQADQRSALRILETINFSASSGINIKQNQVELYITDQAAFEAALATANSKLPPSVVVISTYEPVGDNPLFVITPVPSVFMPQLKWRDDAFMEALLIGELMVEDGCLRVESENESHLVIWQADYFLTDYNGRLQILDERGDVVAQVGETIYMGGGGQPTVDNTELREPLPEQCNGPYWRMGEFLPEEYIPNVAPEAPAQDQTDDWQQHPISDSDLAFTYPRTWYVHETMKALQISPASQPTWSSIAVPNQPNSGPAFDLLYNLNRKMGDTPLLEVENIIQAYGAEDEISVIEPAAPLHDRPDVVIGIYRYVPAEDDLVLLVGAVTNPSTDSPQPTIAMTSVMPQDELAAIQPIFEMVLRSIRLADAFPTATSAIDAPDLNSWVSYENPTLQVALRHPADWTVDENDNSLTLFTPYTAVHDSGAIPVSIWLIEHEKFATDASLYDVIVNAYHFEGVIERFEDTLQDETINGRTVYRSTIIPAALGGQISIFFDDGDRFVEVVLRP